jgi:hypothetical protein
MSSIGKILVGALCLVAIGRTPAYEPAATGTWAVVTRTGEWRDAARDRVIPCRTYQPEGATGRCPVIVFSHGLGGTRDGYANLGRARPGLHVQARGGAVRDGGEARREAQAVLCPARHHDRRLRRPDGLAREREDAAQSRIKYVTARNLLYIASTRARDHLLVTGVDPASEFLDDMSSREEQVGGSDC